MEESLSLTLNPSPGLKNCSLALIAKLKIKCPNSSIWTQFKVWEYCSSASLSSSTRKVFLKFRFVIF